MALEDLKPAYLIHGEDHAAIAQRRANLRALGEGGEGGAASVELLEGEDATPAGLARALCAMTLVPGRRVILLDGVERWRQAEAERELPRAFGALAPETTVALFAREEQRAKVPDAVHEAVRAVGGQIVTEATVKPWELPKWVRAQAGPLGLRLDAAAASALVRHVGERQQRLLRELEKLALQEGATPEQPKPLSAEQIDERAANSSEWRAYLLADALLAGEAAAATRGYLRLREQGERFSGLLYLMAGRLREGLDIAVRLADGESAAAVRRRLRMPQRAAERFIADVARTDPERLRRAQATLADLELDSHGAAPVASQRSRLAALDEDTRVLCALRRMAD